MHRGLPGFEAELEVSKVSDGGGSSAPAATNSSRKRVPIWMQLMKCGFKDPYANDNEWMKIMQHLNYKVTCYYLVKLIYLKPQVIRLISTGWSTSFN
jgi:hypothetical protein